MARCRATSPPISSTVTCTSPSRSSSRWQASWWRFGLLAIGIGLIRSGLKAPGWLIALGTVATFSVPLSQWAFFALGIPLLMGLALTAREAFRIA